MPGMPSPAGKTQPLRRRKQLRHCFGNVMIRHLPAPIRHRLFHTWFLLTRPMTLGTRVMLFNAAGEVCLIRHGYVKGWQLPGGGVDAGETIGDAAIRELAEETGRRPLEPLELFALYKNTLASRRDHVALYVCRASEAIAGFRIDGVEITDCEFFSPSHLPDDLTTSTRRRIMEVTRGTKPDAHW
jgi:8-oxo-dGTP pyrophosphatase MutT (NUDIX family)